MWIGAQLVSLEGLRGQWVSGEAIRQHESDEPKAGLDLANLVTACRSAEGQEVIS